MNILEELEKYIENKNLRPVIARVVATNGNKRTVDCISIDETTRYNGIRLTSSGSLSSNVSLPAINSFVTIILYDEDHGIVLGVSNPSTYTINTTDENGDELGSLKVALDDFNKGLTKFREDYSTAFKLASWATASGPTTPQPFNQVQFDQVFDSLQDTINGFQDQVDNLFSA